MLPCAKAAGFNNSFTLLQELHCSMRTDPQHRGGKEVVGRRWWEGCPRSPETQSPSKACLLTGSSSLSSLVSSGMARVASSASSW